MNQLYIVVIFHKTQNSKVKNEWKWNSLRLTLPRLMQFDDDCKCIVLYGSVIVIFEFKDNCIWCLDAHDLDKIDNTHLD